MTRRGEVINVVLDWKRRESLSILLTNKMDQEMDQHAKDTNIWDMLSDSR